jgi:hypothetical protein
LISFLSITTGIEKKKEIVENSAEGSLTSSNLAEIEVKM